MKLNIGFIGLGHMGFPMANNLLNADITNKLYVYDLAQEPVKKLSSLGAIGAQNLLELAQNCDVIFTMLQTGSQVKAVCLGDEGLFHNSKKDLLYIDCSSIDVDNCKELHQAAKKNNIKMLDAPVSGGVKGASSASLTIMVGGDLLIFNQAKMILEKLGKNIIHAGAEATGQVAKICNNMILGVSMIAVSEAFNLAKKLGLKPQNLFDIVSKGSGECWSLTKYCPYPEILKDVPSSNGYKAGFTSQMMLKDLNLSQEASESAAVHTPMGKLAQSLFQEFSSKYPEMDFSGIINHLVCAHHTDDDYSPRR